MRTVGQHKLSISWYFAIVSEVTLRLSWFVPTEVLLPLRFTMVPISHFEKKDVSCRPVSTFKTSEDYFHKVNAGDLGVMHEETVFLWKVGAS